MLDVTGDVIDPQKVPLPPLLLGLAGLIPFIGLAVAVFERLPSPPGLPSPTTALALYAAIIISFLGGIRWGIAVTERREDGQYALSVLPALVAWALLMAPMRWCLVGLGLVALVLGPIDWQLVSSGLVPAWFGRLRLMLSSGAGLMLLIAASRAV